MRANDNNIYTVYEKEFILDIYHKTKCIHVYLQSASSQYGLLQIKPERPVLSWSKPYGRNVIEEVKIKIGHIFTISPFMSMRRGRGWGRSPVGRTGLTVTSWRCWSKTYTVYIRTVIQLHCTHSSTRLSEARLLLQGVKGQWKHSEQYISGKRTIITGLVNSSGGL